MPSTKQNIIVLVTLLMGFLVSLYGCQQGAIAKLGRDERLYRAKCASCHRLVAPAKHSDEQWHELVKDHGPKMTNEERNAILGYLTEYNNAK